MGIRTVGLALIFSAAVTSCASTTSTTTPATSPSSPTASHTSATTEHTHKVRVPAGFKRVGGAAQGISIAAPASWVSVNLAKDSIERVARRAHLTGISASTLVKDMEALQKQHAVFAFDVKSAVDGSQHFARNLNAYCVNSGVTDVGAAGVPFLRSAASAEFQRLGATHLTQKDVKIGGVPGLVTSYQLSSPTIGPIYGAQLEVLPKPSKACFVTVTVGKGQNGHRALVVAEATAEFP